MSAVSMAVSADAIERTRVAQSSWRRTSLKARLQKIKKIRHLVARDAASLLQHLAVTSQKRAEKLMAEILPFCEAVRFLEDEAAKILAPQRIGLQHTPIWLQGLVVEQCRDPLGAVLIIGPANYPFFLPAVQTIQAITAGNCVFIKPGLDGARVLHVFAAMALEAGIPANIITVLNEDPQAAVSVIAEGVDKIFLTGSSHTGKQIYRQAAPHLTPMVLELSGLDPVFVFRGANLRQAVNAIAFGRRWNSGDTCIAPRRVFVEKSAINEFRALFSAEIADAEMIPVRTFQTEEEALLLAGESRYALGASVFAEERAARRFASKVNAGVVTINDLIAPTAHPGVTFGGRGESGFGSTRGAEGLLQMTNIRTVITQKKRRLRHLEPLPANAEQLFTNYLQAVHAAGLTSRFRSALRLAKSIVKVKGTNT